MKLLSLLLGLLVAVASAPASVDFEWRVENEQVRVGDTVSVGLYAVSAEPEADRFVTMDLVVYWDAEALEYVAVHDNGPASWMRLGFFDDHFGHNLNADLTDGEGWFRGWVNLYTAATPTPDGLLVATVEFRAMSADPEARLYIAERYVAPPQPYVSAAYSAVIPGRNIIGALGAVTIEIDEAALLGDIDGDADVDLGDLSALLAAYGSCEGQPRYNPAADFDGDGRVGLPDLGVLLANYGEVAR